MNYSVRGMLVHNTLTELAEEEGLAGLPRAPQEQWLPPRGVFPGDKIGI